ncbi:TRAP transporter large permease [Reyranella sp.]|uniref:TRAP transporter large permease n=1 Tax=Reyranella sp. TaxID=1929291 RepID=UPI003C7DBEF4
MTGTTAAIAGFAIMLLLMAMRMPIGLSLLFVGGAGYAWLGGWPTFLNYIKATPYHDFSNYTLSVIPLFILMGALAEKSGLSTSLFRAASSLVGHRPGGMAMGLIGACTAFGAICGSSVATTATFARAALPEFERYRYDAGFAAGTVAVGGTLGILIPPSVILVVYGISTEQNIAKLFMAAFIPGFMAAIFYCVVVALVVRRRPELGPALPRVPLDRRLRDVAAVWPAVLVALVVIGGIYGGIFSPTEGAAVGVIAMLVVAVSVGGMRWVGLKAALLQTAETAGMIFLILLGADVFNAFLALSQLPVAAAEWIGNSGFTAYGVMALILLFYILLGAVMDELAMILLTLPIFFPIVQALDFGMPADDVAIWFGVLVLIVVGIGLTAPPIGLNVFVVSAIARHVALTRIYRAVLPFIAADIIRLGLVMAFPALALATVRLLT